MAEIIETPFGAFQQLPGGGFQPVYQIPFGNFVSTPGGGRKCTPTAFTA